MHHPCRLEMPEASEQVKEDRQRLRHGDRQHALLWALRGRGDLVGCLRCPGRPGCLGKLGDQGRPRNSRSSSNARDPRNPRIALVLCRNNRCTGTDHRLCWHPAGTVALMVLLWSSTGSLLELQSSSDAQAMCWYCTGTSFVPTLYWRSCCAAGLVLNIYYTAAALMSLGYCTATVLGFCKHSAHAELCKCHNHGSSKEGWAIHAAQAPSWEH